MSRRNNIWYSLDWYTVALYLVLVFCGWISIYAASFDFDAASTIFSFDTRSGKQLLWILLSLVIGFFILMTEPRTFVSLSYPLYIVFIVLLIITIFVAPDIKGSHSWIVLGPVHLQPAEFAKYGTALALAKMLDNYDFDLKKPNCFFKACALILLPVVFILMQQETGSALVYLALICILYREGMSSLFLFAALCAIVYFVLAVKFASVEWLATPVGEWLVLTLILWVLAYMVPWEDYRKVFYANPRTSGCREIMAIDMPWILNIFGPVKDYKVMKSRNTALDIEFDDNFYIMMEHENGNKGVFVCDVVTPKTERSFEVYGENFFMSWDGSATGIKEWEASKDPSVNPNKVPLKDVDIYGNSAVNLGDYAAFVVENAYLNEIKAFFAYVKEGKKPVYTFEDDKILLEMINDIESK